MFADHTKFLEKVITHTWTIEEVDSATYFSVGDTINIEGTIPQGDGSHPPILIADSIIHTSRRGKKKMSPSRNPIEIVHDRRGEMFIDVAAVLFDGHPHSLNLRFLDKKADVTIGGRSVEVSFLFGVDQVPILSLNSPTSTLAAPLNHRDSGGGN